MYRNRAPLLIRDLADLRRLVALGGLSASPAALGLQHLNSISAAAPACLAGLGLERRVRTGDG